MTPEFAWAIGLFEGEGCVSLTYPGGRNPRAYMRMTLGMVDLDIVTRFQTAVGCGSIRLRPYADRQDLFVWNTTKQEDVEALIERMWPLLSERRRSVIETHRATWRATRLLKVV